MRFPASLVTAALCSIAALALGACDRTIGPASGAQADPPAASRAAVPNVPPAPAASTEAARRRERPPSDAEITARAAAAMRRDPALAGADLSVNTDHGVVNLTGTVRSPAQAAAAEARAQSPSGVMRVETHVSVDPER